MNEKIRCVVGAGYIASIENVGQGEFAFRCECCPDVVRTIYADSEEEAVALFTDPKIRDRYLFDRLPKEQRERLVDASVNAEVTANIKKWRNES